MKAITQMLHNHKQIYFPQRREHRFFYHGNVMCPYTNPVKADFEDSVHTEYKEQIPYDRILHGEHQYDAQKAYDLCPRAKIIFTLRNPVDRAFAQYLHALSEKRESSKTFEDAIQEELSGERTPQNSPNCWIFKNSYEHHIKDWLAFYKKEMMLVTIYEEWSKNSGQSLNEIETFLGLKSSSLSIQNLKSANENTRFLKLKSLTKKRKPRLDPLTRRQLEDLLKVDKLFVTRMVGRDIPSWNTTLV